MIIIIKWLPKIYILTLRDTVQLLDAYTMFSVSAGLGCCHFLISDLNARYLSSPLFKRECGENAFTRAPSGRGLREEGGDDAYTRASSWVGLLGRAGRTDFSSRPSMPGLCLLTPAQGLFVLLSLLSLLLQLSWECLYFPPPH